MKIQKTILVGGILLGVMAVSASANTVKISWGLPGAAATATEYGPDGSTVVRTFKTFCLEDSEFFNPASTFNFTIDNRVIYGGPLSTGNPASAQLTTGAAQLYLDYMSGKPGLTAQAVQEGIWANQGYNNNIHIGDTYYNWSVPAGYTIDQSAYTGHSFEIINLYISNNADGLDNYNNNGVYGQRQSFIYSIPDGGTTISLLGLGFVGLGMLRRKLS